MQFELCMRRVFGDDAYHIASSCLDGEARSKWVSNLFKQLVRDVQELDTTQQHRERISHMLETFMKSKWREDEPSWATVFNLIMLISELMGYQGVRGERAYIPMYWQDLQMHLDIGNARGKSEELLGEFESASRTRAEVVKWLKEKGLSDFDIAMALKTSEHEIKKLKRETSSR